MSDLRRPNIVLTGLPAVGKTTVGKRIASETGREFVDLATELVAKHGNFHELNDAERRLAEHQVVSELTPKRNLVIATTAQTLLDQDNVVALLGTEIFNLDASTAELLDRAEGNGLAMHPELSNAEDPAAAVEQMRQDSADTFGRFTTIDTDGKSAGDVVEALRSSGANIAPPASETRGDSANDSMDQRTQRIFTMIIGSALAVLVVLVVLVLAF